MEVTTYDNMPSLSQYAAMRLARRTKRASASTSSTRVTVVLNAIVRVVLHVAGFALLTLAAFQWNMIAGLAVAGISCFVFSYLMTGTAAAGDESEGRRAQDLRTGR